MDEVIGLATVAELTRFVHLKLCEKDCLDPNQAPMKQSLILRRGKPCGLFFHVQGPRLLRNYAVWAGEEDRILYYDCAGERFAETKLSEGPDPRRLAA